MQIYVVLYVPCLSTCRLRLYSTELRCMLVKVSIRLLRHKKGKRTIASVRGHFVTPSLMNLTSTSPKSPDYEDKIFNSKHIVDAPLTESSALDTIIRLFVKKNNTKPSALSEGIEISTSSIGKEKDVIQNIHKNRERSSEQIHNYNSAHFSDNPFENIMQVKRKAKRLRRKQERKSNNLGRSVFGGNTPHPCSRKYEASKNKSEGMLEGIIPEGSAKHQRSKNPSAEKNEKLIQKALAFDQSRKRNVEKLSIPFKVRNLSKKLDSAIRRRDSYTVSSYEDSSHSEDPHDEAGFGKFDVENENHMFLKESQREKKYSDYAEPFYNFRKRNIGKLSVPFALRNPSKISSSVLRHRDYPEHKSEEDIPPFKYSDGEVETQRTSIKNGIPKALTETARKKDTAQSAAHFSMPGKINTGKLSVPFQELNPLRKSSFATRLTGYPELISNEDIPHSEYPHEDVEIGKTGAENEIQKSLDETAMNKEITVHAKHLDKSRKINAGMLSVPFQELNPLKKSSFATRLRGYPELISNEDIPHSEYPHEDVEIGKTGAENEIQKSLDKTAKNKEITEHAKHLDKSREIYPGKLSFPFEERKPLKKLNSAIRRRDYTEPSSDENPHSENPHEEADIERTDAESEIQKALDETEREKESAENEVFGELFKARHYAELPSKVLSLRDKNSKRKKANGWNKRNLRSRLIKHKNFTPFKSVTLTKKRPTIGNSSMVTIDNKKDESGYFYSGGPNFEPIFEQRPQEHPNYNDAEYDDAHPFDNSDYFKNNP
ncbi:hypothetical protein NPIL_310691 [Nephila pilipes]|uniref:Uncharacterized protein n=1 Tax=Nephila pilipes TaxID=299642 RepID=A0A8X6P9N8_NEPPI|nr:hypothetical protein NPIL_310691 [Nephila pilipes]